MLNLNTESFKKEIESDEGFAVVDFYTTTCGPCRAIVKPFQDQEQKHKHIKFGKIEPTEGHDVFVKYEVGYVPTLILFKDGKEISRNGIMKESEMEKWLKTNTTI